MPERAVVAILFLIGILVACEQGSHEQIKSSEESIWATAPQVQALNEKIRNDTKNHALYFERSQGLSHVNALGTD